MRAPAFDKLNLEALEIQGRIHAALAALRPLKGNQGARNAADRFQTLSEKVKRTQGFRIGFVGSIKAGKSTLLTALLNGELIMPAQAKVCTAALTCIHGTKGAALATATPVTERDLAAMRALVNADLDPKDPNFLDKARFFFKRQRPGAGDEELDADINAFLKNMDDLGDSRAHQIEEARTVLERLERFKQGAGWRWPESEAAKQRFSQAGREIDLNRWASAHGELGGLISRIDIQWPCGWLPEGATLVDTPGLQDPVPSRAKLTYHEMRNLDAVVMCIGDAVQASHLKELKKLLEFGIDPKRILVARTCIDYIRSRQALLDILAATRHYMNVEGWKDIQVIPICALAAAVALTYTQGLDLLPADDDNRDPDEANRLAERLEKRLDLAPGNGLDLEARLWRASNLNALVDGLETVVKASNIAKASLGQVTRDLFTETAEALEEDRSSLEQRRLYLEKVAGGEALAEEIAMEAAELLIHADEKDQERHFQNAIGQVVPRLKESILQHQKGLVSQLAASYRPTWHKVERGGFFSKEGEYALVTHQDGSDCIKILRQSLLEHLSQAIQRELGGLPGTMVAAIREQIRVLGQVSMNAWVDQEAHDICSKGRDAIVAVDSFTFYISDSNWAELKNKAQASWDRLGGHYLDELVGSLLKFLGESLDQQAETAEAKASDLQAEAEGLRTDASSKNQELAKDRLEACILEASRLAEALEALQRAAEPVA